MRKKNVNFGTKAQKSLVAKKKANNSILFPSPAILESYEELYPGFTKELLNLTKIEQEQKEKHYKDVQRSINITQRSGQFFSFVFSLIILYTSINLFESGLAKAASTLFITWFIFLLFLNIKLRR